MKDLKSIEIKNISANGNKITAELACSAGIQKYIINNKFFAEYDTDIESIDESILCIPILSTVITLAWATGSDIYLDSIDSNYLKSLEAIKLNYKAKFNSFQSSTKFHINKVHESKYSTGKDALLFSAGIDSLYSYSIKKSLELDLITIWGSDIPLNKHEYWNTYKERITQFSENEGKKAHFIKSNMRHIVDDSILKREHTIRSWWGLVSHGLMLLGQCAPLTAYNHIGNLFISSSGKDITGAVSILADDGGSWGATKCSVVGLDKSRQEKIKQIVKTPSYLKYIKVCWESRTHYNCGKCEKCSRTLLGLMTEDVDISLCDFSVDENMQDTIKKFIINKDKYLSRNERLFWEDIQKNIPANLEKISPQNREILAWYKNCDLPNLFSEKIEYALIKRENDIIKLTSQLDELSSQNIDSGTQASKNRDKIKGALTKIILFKEELKNIRNSPARKDKDDL